MKLDGFVDGQAVRFRHMGEVGTELASVYDGNIDDPYARFFLHRHIAQRTQPVGEVVIRDRQRIVINGGRREGRHNLRNPGNAKVVQYSAKGMHTAVDRRIDRSATVELDSHRLIAVSSKSDTAPVRFTHVLHYTPALMRS